MINVSAEQRRINQLLDATYQAAEKADNAFKDSLRPVLSRLMSIPQFAEVKESSATELEQNLDMLDRLGAALTGVSRVLEDRISEDYPERAQTIVTLKFNDQDASAQWEVKGGTSDLDFVQVCIHCAQIEGGFNADVGQLVGREICQAIRNKVIELPCFETKPLSENEMTLKLDPQRYVLEVSSFE